MAPAPPPPAPGRILFTNVQPGSFTVADGGGKPDSDGPVTVRFSGGGGGLFSVDGLETFALERDPDAPKAGLSWQSVASVTGSGPITVHRNLFLVATVRFACPRNPTADTFSDTLTVVNAGTGAPMGLTIPIQASLPVEGVQVTDISPDADHTFQDGQAKNLRFRITSSFRTKTVDGIVGDVTQSPDSPFFSGRASFRLAPLGSQELQVSMQCGSTAPPGVFDVAIRVEPTDTFQTTFQAFAFLTRLHVVAPVVASLTADFPATLFLPAGFSRTFHLVAAFSGNATEMDIGVDNRAPVSITGIRTDGVPEIVRGPGTTTLPVTFTAPKTATTSAPLPVTFGWRVPSPDGDATGTVGLNIVTDPAQRVYRINEPGGDLNLARAGDVECSHAEVMISASGPWTFNGSLHDHGTIQGDKFGIAFGCKFFNRNAVAPAPNGFVSPRILGTLGAVIGGSRDRNFSISGGSPFIIANWHDVLEQGISVTLQATSSNIFKDIVDAIEKFFQSLKPPDIPVINAPTICLDPDGTPVNCETGDGG
jgi:hypothetical protein